MAKCDFCRKVITVGTGKQFIKKDGKIMDFCSHKCELNMLKLGRKPRTTKWTGEYHRIKEARKA
ncbi:MAG: 50S ribosomal protein L24e [archaeon]